MAYDSFYSGLSTRASVNEILTLAVATKKEIEELFAQVQAYSLKAAYSYKKLPNASGFLVDPEVATIQHITLTEVTTPITIKIPDDPAIARQVTVILNQGAGARKVTWPSNIVWSAGTAPILSFEPGVEDVITLLFVKGLNRVYGFFNGGSFA